MQTLHKTLWNNSKSTWLESIWQDRSGSVIVKSKLTLTRCTVWIHYSKYRPYIMATANIEVLEYFTLTKLSVFLFHRHRLPNCMPGFSRRDPMLTLVMILYRLNPICFTLSRMSMATVWLTSRHVTGSYSTLDKCSANTPSASFSTSQTRKTLSSSGSSL